MDIERAVSYPFKDQNWIVKTLIGTIVNIIPIVNFIGAGYRLRSIKAVLAGQESAMPEWDNWGDDFVKGLISIIGGLVFAIPYIVVACCQQIITAVLDSATVSTLISCCLFIPYIVYGLLITPMYSLAVVDYARTDNFNAFLDFGGLWKRIQTNTSDTAMFLIFTVVIGIGTAIAFGLTIWLCGLGLVLIFLSNQVTAHLTAQYAAKMDGGDLIKAKNDDFGSPSGGFGAVPPSSPLSPTPSSSTPQEPKTPSAEDFFSPPAEPKSSAPDTIAPLSSSPGTQGSNKPITDQTFFGEIKKPDNDDEPPTIDPLR